MFLKGDKLIICAIYVYTKRPNKFHWSETKILICVNVSRFAYGYGKCWDLPVNQMELFRHHTEFINDI